MTVLTVVSHSRPMVMPKENIAHILATSQVVLAVMGMSDEIFDAEKHYGATMIIAKSMLHKGIITQEEYRKIDKEMLEKYKPVFGQLLAIVP